MKCKFVIVYTLTLITFLTACEDEKTTPPVISLGPGSAYVSGDTTLKEGTVFNVLVNASKTGNEEFLTSFNISKSVNGSPDSVIQSANFVYQYFSQYYSYKTGDSGKLERYTFTVGEQNGQTANVSINITVN